MIKRIFLGVSQGLHYPSFTSLIGEKVRDGERSLLGVSLFAKLAMSLSVTNFIKNATEKRSNKKIPSKPYAFIASGGQIGLLIVGSAGSWLAHSYQWDKLFQFIGFLSFIWILLLYRMNKQYKAQSKYSYTPIQKGTVGIL